jgi:proline iminopeptidase
MIGRRGFKALAKATPAASFASSLFSTSVASTARNAGQNSSNGRKVMAVGLAAGIAAASFFTSSTLYAQSEGKESGAGGADPFAHTKLFKPIEPFLVGKLKVSPIHTISYECYGNPKGKPVLFVHGGPGGGTDPAMARFFDPKVYRIVLVDQRGCGNSTPFANLEDNNTWELVKDFEKVREKLGIDKWQVFGGSWGSTLGLTYAMMHPERTTELVLRGIFMLRKKELDWFYEGVCHNIFPEEWEAYANAIPESEHAGGFIKAYGRRLRGEMGEAEMIKAANAWSIWEGSTSKLTKPDKDTTSEKYGDGKFSVAFARIENHYFTNKGFFARDGWLLEDAQINRIKHIPTTIVQGQYDCVCPATTAYELSKKLPDAKVHFTKTGHSGFEDDIIEKLVDATNEYKHRQ